MFSRLFNCEMLGRVVAPDQGLLPEGKKTFTSPGLNFLAVGAAICVRHTYACAIRGDREWMYVIIGERGGSPTAE